MSLDSGQQDRLSLASTTALPAPGPALAKIKWADASTPKNDNSLVEIAHEKTPTHAVIWVVRLGDLKGIQAKAKLDAEEKDITWSVGDQVQSAIVGATNEVLTGIAYVREEAQTLFRQEHGVSVVNSVELATGHVPQDYDATGCDRC